MNLNSKELWKFSSIMNIEESNFNRALERFYNLGIYGLVRENIQNSLDAKIAGSDEPVIVVIETGRIDKEDVPGFEEIKNRIFCLEGRNNHTRETIEHMKSNIDEDVVDYISFEDSNTRGLTGAANGQSNCKEDTWGIYAYNKGVHFEEDNEEVEQYRGGSHGIGKIASNSASEIFMTYFANCDEFGNQHLGGTVQLIEHKYNNNYYRSTGYFTDVKDISEVKTKFYPYKNEFNDIFRKDTRGLKIIIPFLRTQFNNEREIIKSICDSFFISILENNLKVIVNDKMINSETIENYILNKEYYEQDVSLIKEEFTPLYLNTYKNMQPRELIIKSIKNNYKFKLYFNYDERISKGRVGIIRTIGMKIEDKRITSNVNKPFNAVLIPCSTTEDAFLKSLENESHTELSFEHIKNQGLQRDAKRFINNISREVAKIIDEEIRKNNPTDGFMDTKDILYIVENEFKKDLTNSIETVKLSKGKKNTTVIKTKDKVPKKKKKKDGKGEPKKRKKKTRVVTPKPENDYSDEDKTTKYSTSPDIVNRLILKERELLEFDFRDNKDLLGIDACDISLAVVDGMGKEYNNEFNMKDNYKSAIDTNTGKACNIENNIIKDVAIKNSLVNMELELDEKYNKSLKFIYYVEV